MRAATRWVLASGLCIASAVLAHTWWQAGVRPAADRDFARTRAGIEDEVETGPTATARLEADRLRAERAELERAFARTEAALTAQRGDVGQPLDPDGEPPSRAAPAVADPGEPLDPEFAPPAPPRKTSATHVGEYLDPQERYWHP